MAKKQEPKDEPKADEPKVEQQRDDNSGLAALAGLTIDERMANLLKDHQEMGARPK